MTEPLNAWMETHPALFQLTAIAALLVACYVVNLILRHGVIPLIQKLTRRSRTSWDDWAGGRCGRPGLPGSPAWPTRS